MFLECRYSLTSKRTQIEQICCRKDPNKTDFYIKFELPPVKAGGFFCSDWTLAKLVWCNYAVLSSKTLNKESQSILFSNWDNPLNDFTFDKSSMLKSSCIA